MTEMSPASIDDDGHTGVAEVDQALARLDDLNDLPVADHPAVFESVHRALRGALSGDGS